LRRRWAEVVVVWVSEGDHVKSECVSMQYHSYSNLDQHHHYYRCSRLYVAVRMRMRMKMKMKMMEHGRMTIRRMMMLKMQLAYRRRGM
jgi:hypothetical protein